MERDLFRIRLQTASKQATEFAREYITQSLPECLAYLVLPNQSCDNQKSVGDEVVFPEESLPDGEHHGPWQLDETVSFLWRECKVPEWIDIAVYAEDERYTLLELRCCGRFTSQEELLYHRPGGLAPFSIKSPVLPPGWMSVDVSGKFDLYWRAD
jgi:hypothetical protein